METFIGDVRYGLRSLLRNPGYTLAVIATLGLGIGANTAIFSIIYGVVLKPLPYGDGDRLVFLRQPQPGSDVSDLGFSVRDIEDLQDRTHTLEGVAEYHAMTFTLLGRGDAEQVQTGVVSAHFFDLLDMQPILGRDFVESDDLPGAEPVLILSHGYWQRRFGADPAIVGQAVEMNGLMHTVIGVLPPVPQFPDENDVYMPTSACPIRSSDQVIEAREMRMMSVFGRARPGVSVAQVDTDLHAVATQLADEYPEAYDASMGQTLSASPLKEELVQNARPVFLVLLGTAGLVLLIACANIANLAMARFSGRGQEMAVRSALGAGRGRLVRQLLTETGLLALAGGLVGVGVALGGHGLLVGFASRFTPRAVEATLDLPILVFALAISALAGFAFGAGPAWTTARRLGSDLRHGSGQSNTTRKVRMQSVLVSTQVALAFTLLVAAGLTLRSFWLLQKVDPGFDPERLVSMEVDVNGFNSTMDAEQRRQFYFTLVERIGAMAGVESVALTGDGPLTTSMMGGMRIRAEGDAEPERARLPLATMGLASEGYFETMRIPVRAGRTFRRQDADLTGLVAVVTESFARRAFPGEDPVGRTFESCPGWSESCMGPFEVVGVVADYHASSLEDEADAMFFRASRQSGFPGQTLVIRTRGEATERLAQFADVVKELDPTIPVAEVASMVDRVDENLAPRRLTLILLLLFAAVALVVSVAGIAGMVAFSVSQRTQEIGIRLALGAERAEVRRHMAGRGMAMVGVGLAVGMGFALALRSVVESLLWGIPSLDLATWAATAVILGSVGFAACYVPARRATRIDPLRALRVER